MKYPTIVALAIFVMSSQTMAVPMWQSTSPDGVYQPPALLEGATIDPEELAVFQEISYAILSSSAETLSNNIAEALAISEANTRPNRDAEAALDEDANDPLDYDENGNLLPGQESYDPPNY